jgi:hypothetical protein
MVQDWEAKNGALKAGEVVLFYSEYSDKYYKPFRRVTASRSTRSS